MHSDFYLQVETDAEKLEKSTEAKNETTEEKEADQKPKVQKKSKISVDIEVELEGNDVLQPTLEDIEASKKKYVFILSFL